jgi:hypothetical protein
VFACVPCEQINPPVTSTVIKMTGGNRWLPSWYQASSALLMIQATASGLDA